MASHQTVTWRPAASSRGKASAGGPVDGPGSGNGSGAKTRAQAANPKATRTTAPSTHLVIVGPPTRTSNLAARPDPGPVRPPVNVLDGRGVRARRVPTGWAGMDGDAVWKITVPGPIVKPPADPKG